MSAFADFTSANTNVAAIGAGSGAVSGMGLGSTTVQVVYAGLTNNIAITVRPPSFTDEFNVVHDYVASGTTGSPWDGLYLNQGDIPETGFAGTGSSSAAIASGAKPMPAVRAVINIGASRSLPARSIIFGVKCSPSWRTRCK